MFCPSCGNGVDPSHRFCYRCGGSLEGLPSEEQTTTPAPLPTAATPVASQTPAATPAPPSLLPDAPSSSMGLASGLPTLRSLESTAPTSGVPSSGAPAPQSPAPESPVLGVPSLAARLAALPPVDVEPLPIEPLPPMPSLAELALTHHLGESTPGAGVPPVPELPVARADSAPTPALGLPSTVPPLPSFSPPSGPVPLIPPLADSTPAAPARPLITAPIPQVLSVPTTDQFPSTVSLDVGAAVDDGPAWQPESPTQPTDAVRSGTTRELPAVAAAPFRISAQLVLAALAAVVAVATVFVDFASFDVTGTDRISASIRLGDLAYGNITSLSIGVALLFAGAIAGAAGQRVGVGLAAGGGLGLAGMLLNTVGLGVTWLDTAEVAYLPTPGNVITVTRDIGFFMAIGAAALAALSAFVSLGAARGGRRSFVGLVVIGIGAAIAAGVGPLLPGGGADWFDNISQPTIPPATLYVRLGVIVLFLVGSIIGFAISGRFGGAMVLGAAAIAVQQTVMATLELDERSFGFAVGNPSGGGGFDLVPHPLTLAALGAVLLVGLLAIVLPLRDDH